MEMEIDAIEMRRVGMRSMAGRDGRAGGVAAPGPADTRIREGDPEADPGSKIYRMRFR